MHTYKKIQVLEHQSLKVGQELNGYTLTQQDLEAFKRFHFRNKKNYFSLIHNGVKFSHFVGVIQIGHLVIEVLPKLSQDTSQINAWQDALIQMLKTCKLLKIHVPHDVQGKWNQHSLLQIFIKEFLYEVHGLVKKGIFKSYKTVFKNSTQCKGQIYFAKQITENIVHKERFFTRHNIYDQDHLFNQVIAYALYILKKTIFHPNLQKSIFQLSDSFRGVSIKKIQGVDFDTLRKSKEYSLHARLIDFSEMIINNFCPDVKAGKRHISGIMFDMNLLFEEYIYQKLKSHSKENLLVKRQQKKSFWRRQYIQPDIYLEIDNQRFVIDTKWKMLKHIQPSSQDLKQLYVYCNYFNAQKGILLYPAISSNFNTVNEPYQPILQEESAYNCQIVTAPILQNNRINREIADVLLKIIN